MRACSSRVTSRKLWLTSAVGAFAALALAGTAWSGEGPKKDEVFKVTHVIQVPGVNLFSFDISWYDPALNKYFLADRNNKAIDVIDGATHSITQTVNSGYAGVNAGGNDFSGPDGLATVNNHTEVWVGDSPGKVWVQDSTTLAVKTSAQLGGAANPISVGGTSRADEFCTDPNNHVVMIASPAEGDPHPKVTIPPTPPTYPFVTFISTTTYKVLGKLTFDGSPAAGGLKATNGLEQCGWSPKTGKFYQNVPENNGAGDDTSPGAVAVIDPTTMKVTTSFPVPIADCAGPQGMAIGPDNQILLGCNAKSPDGHRNVVVINANNGAVLKTIPDLGGADEVWFNEGDGHYVIPSCNTPCRTVPVTGAVTGPELLGIVDAHELRLDHTVTVGFQNSDTTVTSGNPRTIHSAAANSKTGEIYLPIPAVGGNAPQFDPTLCDSFGQGITRTGSPSAATGCIVILKAKNDDRPRFARERDRDDRRDGDDHHGGDDHHHDD
jgi:hypothetical protein